MASKRYTTQDDFARDETDFAGNRRDRKDHDHDRGLVSTMMDLGAATTRFTLDQMQTAATMLINPGRAIGHMKDSMAAISKALNDSSGNGERSDSRRTRSSGAIMEDRPVHDSFRDDTVRDDVVNDDTVPRGRKH
jgi:hypothetical protein